jgi:hypothetical protein
MLREDSIPHSGHLPTTLSSPCGDTDVTKKNPGAAFTLGSQVNGGRGGTRTHDLTDVKCISYFGYLRAHGYELSKAMRP